MQFLWVTAARFEQTSPAWLGSAGGCPTWRRAPRTTERGYIAWLKCIQLNRSLLAGVQFTVDIPVSPLRLGRDANIYRFNLSSSVKDWRINCLQFDRLIWTSWSHWSQAQNLIIDVALEWRQSAVNGRGAPKCLTELKSVVRYPDTGLKQEKQLRRRDVSMPSCIYAFRNYEEVPLEWAEINNDLRQDEDPNYNNS